MTGYPVSRRASCRWFPAQSALAKAIGNDFKGKLSSAFCVAGIALSFVQTWMADLIHALVALMWFIPDRRIEKALPNR